MTRQPTFFLSHGGGPWPWLDGAFRIQFDKVERSLLEVVASLPAKPKAILVISGHWEEDRFTVMSAPSPGMVYDYGGFPKHTYEIRYAAPGAPEVAQRVKELIEAAGLPAALDPERGFDHGTFVPLAVMYPDADMPVLQLSVRRGYDPSEHLALGRALAPLREEGVVIVGSGLSYHNLRAFGEAARDPSEAFDGWLGEALGEQPEMRTRRIENWESAPAARIAHPEEDHLIPLMVALGAAEQDPATRIYHEQGFMGGVTASSYRFG